MEDMQLEKHEVKTTVRKLKGGWSLRPDGQFLLTPNEDPEAHLAFWEQMEKTLLTRNEM